MRSRQKSGFKRFLICIVYVVYSLYYIADMETSANVVVKQTASRSSVHTYLVALIGVLGIYMVARTVYRLDFRISRINIPLIALACWGVVSDVLNGAGFWSIAVHIGLIVLWVLVIYFMNDVVVDEKSYKLALLFECLIWLVTIYYSNIAFTNFANYTGDEVGSVLNISYNVLVLIPFLLQIRNKILRYTTMLISCGFIVLSMKRGAIIVMVIMLFVYYYMQTKSERIKKLSFGRILVIASLLVAAFFVVNKISNGFLMTRFSIAEIISGSDRDLLYSSAISDIKSRSFIDLLIGKGSGSSLNIIGNGVHNEILEMIFSYGIIGLGIYLWLIVRGINILRQLLKQKNSATAYYAIALVYIIFVGFVGTALFAHYTFHIMAALGISSSYLVKNEETLLER